MRSFVDNCNSNYYRRQQFSYTLQPPKAEGMDSIDTFMFTHKRGFCEHYAQSFVVMMRAAGVPARVVTGYLGGEYQSNGNFWQIRSKNAHAWAEVWLPNEQAWLRVDPTGAVSGRIQGGLDAALPENERELLPQPKQHMANMGRNRTILLATMGSQLRPKSAKQLICLIGLRQL